MEVFKTIGIIGGGFCGTLTAIHLIEKSTVPIHIFIINKKTNFNKGIAYHTYTDKHLLNVSAGKMSAFHNIPDHFLDWIMRHPKYKNKDREIIKSSFLPRSMYGEYLEDLWQRAIINSEFKNLKIISIDDFAVDLKIEQTKFTIALESKSSTITVDYCVLATGNNLPRNPVMKNTGFHINQHYFQNPWKENAVKNVSNHLPILIIGNGLTMVDTVISLIEHGYKGQVYSLSPNGFNILPHRHNGMVYEKLKEDLKENLSLLELVKVINKHVKLVRSYGLSAEPVIDALKPYVHGIWRSLKQEEKQLFLTRLRHLWGVARHRLPLTIHDKIQQLRIDRNLNIISGKIIDIESIEIGLKIDYFDKKEGATKHLLVQRVINCTGPETDISRLKNGLLKSSLLSGLISQDELKLGIKTNVETFQVYDNKGVIHDNLFATGSILKGMLWESTSVNELRYQAEKVADYILQN